MPVVECDERGRLVVPKDVREKYGNAFYVVKGLGKVVLIPVAKDPLKDLEELGEKLPELSVKEIKERARKRALKEALEESTDAQRGTR